MFPPNTVRLRSVKGKSGSRVFNRSFLLSDWRLILQNTTFKRNYDKLKIYCMQCMLVMQIFIESPPLRFTPFPAPAPRKPPSSPLFPGPWLHVFSSLTLWVWFLFNKDFVDGLIWWYMGAAFDTKKVHYNVKWNRVPNLLSHAQTICDPKEYSPPGFSVHGPPGKNTAVGSHSLLQQKLPQDQTWVSCFVNRLFTV